MKRIIVAFDFDDDDVIPDLHEVLCKAMYEGGEMFVANNVDVLGEQLGDWTNEGFVGRK